jgi:ABC-type Na+ efflux pump permease subunit
MLRVWTARLVVRVPVSDHYSFGGDSDVREETTMNDKTIGKRSGSLSTAGSAWKPTFWAFAICIVLVMVLVPAGLFAQVGTADILGSVTDPSGAVVQNAKVTVTNLGTSATRTAVTNDRGEYIFSLLPNGKYSINVESTGFKTYEVNNFALSTGDRLRMDARLETGAVTEKVEVTATAAALQTDSSTVGSTVEEKQVQDLP